MRSLAGRAFLLALAVTAAAFEACGGDGAIDDALQVELTRLEFKIPGSLAAIAVTGDDAVVGEWRSAELSLFVNLSGSTDALGNNGKDEFRLTIMTIDGREATIERFMDPGGDATRPYVAAVHFADAGEGQQLTMFGRGATEDDQDTLLAIFRSLKFREADA